MNLASMYLELLREAHAHAVSQGAVLTGGQVLGLGGRIDDNVAYTVPTESRNVNAKADSYLADYGLTHADVVGLLVNQFGVRPSDLAYAWDIPTYPVMREGQLQPEGMPEFYGGNPLDPDRAYFGGEYRPNNLIFNRQGRDMSQSMTTQSAPMSGEGYDPNNPLKRFGRESVRAHPDAQGPMYERIFDIFPNTPTEWAVELTASALLGPAIGGRALKYLGKSLKGIPPALLARFRNITRKPDEWVSPRPDKPFDYDADIENTIDQMLASVDEEYDNLVVGFDDEGRLIVGTDDADFEAIRDASNEHPTATTDMVDDEFTKVWSEQDQAFVDKVYEWTADFGYEDGLKKLEEWRATLTPEDLEWYREFIIKRKLGLGPNDAMTPSAWDEMDRMQADGGGRGGDPPRRNNIFDDDFSYDDWDEERILNRQAEIIDGADEGKWKLTDEGDSGWLLYVEHFNLENELRIRRGQRPLPSDPFDRIGNMHDAADRGEYLEWLSEVELPFVAAPDEWPLAGGPESIPEPGMDPRPGIEGNASRSGWSPDFDEGWMTVRDVAEIVHGDEASIYRLTNADIDKAVELNMISQENADALKAQLRETERMALEGLDLEGPPGTPDPFAGDLSASELTPESMVQAIREHYTAKWESMTPESRASWMQMGRMNSPDDLDGYLDGMVDNIVGGGTPLDPAIGWGNLPEGIERRAHEIAAEGPPGTEGERLRRMAEQLEADQARWEQMLGMPRTESVPPPGKSMEEAIRSLQGAAGVGMATAITAQTLFPEQVERVVSGLGRFNDGWWSWIKDFPEHLDWMVRATGATLDGMESGSRSTGDPVLDSLNDGWREQVGALSSQLGGGVMPLMGGTDASILKGVSRDLSENGHNGNAILPNDIRREIENGDAMIVGYRTDADYERAVEHAGRYGVEIDRHFWRKPNRKNIRPAEGQPWTSENLKKLATTHYFYPDAGLRRGPR